VKSRISVVINTVNEERNLPSALDSVFRWAAEIVIVDMYSDDRTVEIAQQYGAKVYLHPKVNFVEPARAFAIAKATSEWVLLLDADEMIPERMSKILVQIAVNDSCDACTIPRLNYIFGSPVWHGGFGPHQDPQMRFFKKDKVIPLSKIHHPISTIVGARIHAIAYRTDLAIIHFSYSDIAQVIEKFNRYTTVEAQQAFEYEKRATRFKALLYVIWEFLSRFIWKKGYRDGWRGFYFAGFMSIYRWLTYSKLEELHSTGGKTKVVEMYSDVAIAISLSYEQDVEATENYPL